MFDHSVFVWTFQDIVGLVSLGCLGLFFLVAGLVKAFFWTKKKLFRDKR